MDEQERKRAEELGFEFVEGKEPGEPFWPNHVLTQVISVYIALAIVFALAILAPWGLHEKADPMQTPHAIKPEWYFLSSYQLLKYISKPLGMFISTLGFVLMVIWPFLDRRRVKSPRKRPVSLLVAAAGVTMVLALTIVGALSENNYKLGDTLYHVDPKGFWHTLERDDEGKYFYINIDDNVKMYPPIPEEYNEETDEE